LNGRAIGAKHGRMTLAAQRRFVTPEPDETLEALAARAMPDQPREEAMDLIRGWNLHIFAMRRPRGLLLGSDVVFVEPPPV
jgi:hypothetical protein